MFCRPRRSHLIPPRCKPPKRGGDGSFSAHRESRCHADNATIRPNMRPPNGVYELPGTRASASIGQSVNSSNYRPVPPRFRNVFKSVSNRALQLPRQLAPGVSPGCVGSRTIGPTSIHTSKTAAISNPLPMRRSSDIGRLTWSIPFPAPTARTAHKKRHGASKRFCIQTF